MRKDNRGNQRSYLLGGAFFSLSVSSADTARAVAFTALLPSDTAVDAPLTAKEPAVTATDAVVVATVAVVVTTAQPLEATVMQMMKASAIERIIPLH